MRPRHLQAHRLEAATAFEPVRHSDGAAVWRDVVSARGLLALGILAASSMVLAIMAVDYLDRPSVAPPLTSPREVARQGDARPEPAREKIASAPMPEPRVTTPPVAIAPPEPPPATIAMPAPAVAPPPVELRAAAEASRRSAAAEPSFALASDATTRIGVRGDVLPARATDVTAGIAVLADLQPSGSVAAPTVAFEMAMPVSAPVVTGVAASATEAQGGGETTSSLARPAAIPLRPDATVAPAKAAPKARAAAPRPAAKPAKTVVPRAKPAKPSAVGRKPATTKPETTDSVRRPAPRTKPAPAAAQPYTLPSALRP